MPFADVDRDGMACLGRLPNVLGQPTDQMRRRSGDLLDRLFVVVFQMPLVHFQDRHHFDFVPSASFT